MKTTPIGPKYVQHLKTQDTPDEDDLVPNDALLVFLRAIAFLGGDGVTCDELRAATDVPYEIAHRAIRILLSRRAVVQQGSAGVLRWKATDYGVALCSLI